MTVTPLEYSCVIDTIRVVFCDCDTIRVLLLTGFFFSPLLSNGEMRGHSAQSTWPFIRLDHQSGRQLRINPTKERSRRSALQTGGGGGDGCDSLMGDVSRMKCLLYSHHYHRLLHHRRRKTIVNNLHACKKRQRSGTNNFVIPRQVSTVVKNWLHPKCH